MDKTMTAFLEKIPYAEPLCEWERLGQADLLCVSPGAIEDIELEDWIND